MRPQGLQCTVGFFIFYSFFFYPSLSFASSRQQIINNALTETESSHASENTPYQNSYSAKTLYPDVPPEKTIMGPSEPYDTLNISHERNNVINRTLNLYVSAGYDLNHIHYSEWSGQEKLDEDFGMQNGFYINLGYKSPRYNETLRGKPFVEGYYRKYGNTIRYKGAAFDSFNNTTPFNTDQDSKITRFGLKLGTHTNFRKTGEAFLYLDGGRRIWDRGENEIVDGVIKYKETYEWWYYGVGVGFNSEVLPKLSLGIDWTGWLTSLPKMRSYLYEGGTFNLKNVWGTEVKLPIKYKLSDKLSFDLTPYYTFWRINESDVVSISGVPYVEPDSNTNELGILFGFTYAL